MRKKMICLSLSVIVIMIWISSSSYGQKGFITVNGKKVEIFTSGLENNMKGKPVIVFENGMASKLDNWGKVIEEVSKSSAVFSYNRPRIGESENDSIPPSTKHIVDNLRTMLLQKGLEPPYLLVSHSFGGAYIRSFASYYPKEIAGLIFIDPVDITKKKGYGDLPYLEIGLTKNQIDSMFAKPYANFTEKLYAEMPNYYVEEVKISGELHASEFEECNRVPLPDIPVIFIVAGGFSAVEDDRGKTIFDKEKLFRADSYLKMKRWLELLYPLKYGKLIYCSKSGHAVQRDEPETVIASIKLALNNYDKIKNEKIIH